MSDFYLECLCCGDVAFTSGPDGLIWDNQEPECGCVGIGVFIETDDDPPTAHVNGECTSCEYGGES